MKNARRILPGRQRLLGLALVALWAGSLLDAGAQSTIVYGRFPPTIVPPPAFHFPNDDEGTRLFPGLTNASTCPMNFNGQLAYTFIADQMGFDIYPWFSNAVIALPVGQLGSTFAIALAAGQEIGPDAQGYLWQARADGPGGSYGPGLMGCADFGCRGFFVGLESAYVGLRFQQDGNTFYGWVRVGAPLSGPAGGLSGGWLYDFAYETRPDTPIKAGAQPVAVPLGPPAIVRPGYLRLNWPSEIGKAYQVQAKTSLDAYAWTNLRFAIPATSTNTMVDLPMTGPAQFFRVVEAD